VAERPRPQDHSPEAESALSERAQVLQNRVERLFQDFQPEVGATFDIPEFLVKPENIVDICRTLKEEPDLSFKLLLCLAGVDYVEYFQLVYVLLSLEHEQKLVIKTNVPFDNPRLPTVAPVWRGAAWYEREAHDLFGIEFEGHPDMSPLLLYEGFEGYPGRRSHPFHDYQEF
jgi:NADH-quinone oxidoreductase subunit C